MKRVCIILFVASFATATTAQDSGLVDLKAQTSTSFEQAKDRRTTVVEDLMSPNALTSLLALAEIEGGLSSDPQTARMLVDQALSRAEGGATAAELSGLLKALARLKKDAWTSDTLGRANGLLLILRKQETDRDSEGTMLLKAVADSLRATEGTETLYGEIQGRTEATLQFADVDLFICPAAAEEAVFVRQVRQFGQTLAKNDFGRIRLRRSTERQAITLGLASGKSILFFDAGHGEERLVEGLVARIEKSGLPPVEARKNSGSPSFWYLSVFICP